MVESFSFGRSKLSPKHVPPHEVLAGGRPSELNEKRQDTNRVSLTQHRSVSCLLSYFVILLTR